MDNLARKIADLERRLQSLELAEVEATIYLDTPLGAAAWDGGDAFSTTAKTKIDLSAVFTGVPAGIRAVYVHAEVRDTGSAANDCFIALGSDATANRGEFFQCTGQTNDSWGRASQWVKCDTAGDVYYQILASGAGSMRVVLYVIGWLL